VEYYNRYKPFSKGKTIATEMKVNLDLLGDRQYTFIGYIDRLDSVTDGVYEIHDYKTSRSLPTQDKQDRDRQLALYEIGVRQMWQDVKEVDLVWHYLMFDKEIRSKRTHEHLSQLKQELLEVIKQIEKAVAEDDFPAVESGLCGWCAYQDHCKLKKHQVRTKQLPLNKYLEEEGVVLANKYAELKAKEKEFSDWYEKECSLLTEALIAYSKKEGVEYVYGTDKRVGIKFGEAFRFPETGTEERTKLETYLKERGLWETYSILNTRALDKALKDGETDPKIKKYAKKEEINRITLGKVKETH
jgi:putative RecB family exonuclease